MAMDPTPWLVGGGAEHPPEIARLIPYLANGGREGVGEPADMKVTPLPTPGGGVAVAPGAVLVRNLNPGGGQQTYMGRNPATSTVDVQPTGSSGGRADMVAVVVRDPQYPGTPVPDDPLTARYVDIEVIQGVPSNARTAADAGLTFPAYPLARINLPANTGTVQASHITDLRQLVSPQVFPDKYEQMVGDRTEVPRTGTFRTLTEIPVDVPDWATHAAIDVGIGGAYMRGVMGRGDFGFSGLGNTGAIGHTPWWEDGGSTTGFRRIQHLQAGRKLRVRPEYRGTTATIYVIARVHGGSDSNFVFGADYGARAFADVLWLQEIE